MRRILRLSCVVFVALSALAAGGLTSSAAEARSNILGLSPPWQVVAIVLGTLLSEDLTAIAVGTFVRQKQLDPVLGTVACFAGIWVGDLGYWLLGRLVGKTVLQSRWLSRRLPLSKLEVFGAWFDCRPWAAVTACRFLPGIRVPLYVSIGALTRRFWAFVFWTFLAAGIWTPVLVYLVVVLGDVFVKPFEWIVGAGWVSIALASLAVYALVRLGTMLCTQDGREKLRKLTCIRKRANPPTECAERDIPVDRESSDSSVR